MHFLSTPPREGPAAQVRDLVHRTGDLLWRCKRPGEPGRGINHPEPGADLAA